MRLCVGMSSSTLKFSIQFLSCCSTLSWGFHPHSFLRFPQQQDRLELQEKCAPAPVWLFSVLKRDELTFPTATSNCFFFPCHSGTKPLTYIFSTPPAVIVIAVARAVAGPCLLLGPAWSEKKAPSYGTPVSFLCIPGLHPPDSLLQLRCGETGEAPPQSCPEVLQNC